MPRQLNVAGFPRLFKTGSVMSAMKYTCLHGARNNVIQADNVGGIVRCLHQQLIRKG